MYTEKDYAAASRKMRGHLWICLALLAVAIGGMCAGLGMRNKWLATLAPVAGSWAFYTWLTLKFLPWFRYSRFLNAMKEGRRRETECYFLGVADSLRVVDGVQIRDFNASLDAAGEDGRLFYWDGDKPMPEMRVGQKLRVTSYGNFITDCAEE